MQGSVRLGKEEVVHEGAIRLDGLSSYACLVRQQVAEPQFGAVFSALIEIARLPQGVSKFLHGRTAIGEDRFPESGEKRVICHVRKIEGELRIAFAGKPEDCVWTDRHTAVDHARQMDPEKRERRIRDRVDQMLDDVVLVCGQPIVFAAEGYDPEVDGKACQTRQAIGLQPAAHDQFVGPPACAVTVDFHAIGLLANAGDTGRQTYLSTAVDDARAHLAAHIEIADDTG